MTDKKMRTLDEMLTNLEIWSTWNKTFADEMIGICSKMQNLLADRKTENSSEIPNNCEPQYEVGMGTLKCDNCSEYGSFKCTKCDGEMYFKRFEPKTEPQTERSE